MSKIVHVHIPKCGGTSFRQALAEHMPVKTDYAHRINRDPHVVRQEMEALNTAIVPQHYANVACISGHFFPSRYLKLYHAGWKFITWLRDPAQRLCAQYEHIIRQTNEYYSEEKDGTLGAFVVRNGLSLEDFLLDPRGWNQYQPFFEHFPPEQYFFIGILEQVHDDLNYLSELLQIELRMHPSNCNPKKSGTDYSLDPKLQRKLREAHAADYKLYEQLLKLSENRP